MRVPLSVLPAMEFSLQLAHARAIVADVWWAT